MAVYWIVLAAFCAGHLTTCFFGAGADSQDHQSRRGAAADLHQLYAGISADIGVLIRIEVVQDLIR